MIYKRRSQHARWLGCVGVVFASVLGAAAKTPETYVLSGDFTQTSIPFRARDLVQVITHLPALSRQDPRKGLRLRKALEERLPRQAQPLMDYFARYASDPCLDRQVRTALGLRTFQEFYRATVAARGRFDAACADLERQDYREARARLDEAISLGVGFRDAYLHRAIVHEILGEPEAAGDDFQEGRKSLRGEPSAPAQSCLCSPALAAAAERLERRMLRGRDLKDEGVSLFLKGDPAAAARRLDEAILLAPGDPETYQSRAVVRESLGDTAGALADEVKAAEHSARQPRFQASALASLARLRRSVRPGTAGKTSPPAVGQAMERGPAAGPPRLERIRGMLAAAARQARRLWRQRRAPAPRPAARGPRPEEPVDAAAYCEQKRRSAAARGAAAPDWLGPAVEPLRRAYLAGLLESTLRFAGDEARVDAGRRITPEMVDSAFAAASHMRMARDDAQRVWRLHFLGGPSLVLTPARFDEPGHDAAVWAALAVEFSGPRDAFAPISAQAVEDLHEKASAFDLALLQLSLRCAGTRRLAAVTPEALRRAHGRLASYWQAL
jgi:hypothetical protein